MDWNVKQTLDEVTAYSYTLSGGRPAGVKGLSLQSPFVMPNI